MVGEWIKGEEKSKCILCLFSNFPQWVWIMETLKFRTLLQRPRGGTSQISSYKDCVCPRPSAELWSLSVFAPKAHFQLELGMELSTLWWGPLTANSGQSHWAFCRLQDQTPSPLSLLHSDSDFTLHSENSPTLSLSVLTSISPNQATAVLAHLGIWFL